MRGSELLDKMELMDPKYVEAAEGRPKRRKNPWLKWSAAAACLALLVLAGVLIPRSKDDSSRVLPGGIVREYRNISLTKDELAIEWPWEYKTVSEQYTTLILDGEEFYSGRAVDASYVGDIIGSYDVTGCDSYTDQEHRMTAEVYQIAGISKERLVAVKLEGAYYVFSRGRYDPPADLGEVLDDYSLEQTLPLEQFAECEGYDETGYFRLNDDAYIWEVLKGCRSAEFVGDAYWDNNGRGLSFTASSEALGVYKSVFVITEDGYVKTNVFAYGYVFRIGREAAEQIISYAAENRTESKPEPYLHSLAGTLTGITEDYILVDDSILCSDERDGMSFKIYLDDIRVRRHIEFEGISVGDIVVVSFTGDIDAEAGNVVGGVCSLSRGYLSEDGVSVLE